MRNPLGVDSGGAVRRMFRAGVTMTRQDDGSLRIERESLGFVLRNVPADVTDVLKKMLGGDVSPVPRGAGVSDAVDRIIDRIERLVEYRITDANGDDVIAVETMVRADRHAPTAVQGDTLVRLSRFAYLRRYESSLVLESPRSPRRVRLLAAWSGSLLTALGTALTVRELAARVATTVSEAVHLTSHLIGAGLVDHAVDVSFTESESEQQWSFHDLLFHTRSRAGRHDYPVGGTFPFAGLLPAASATRPCPEGPAVELFRPDFDEVLRCDPPLTVAIEARRSVRHAGTKPADDRLLGEFLFRVARIRSATAANNDNDTSYSATSRPYPSGGATYDIELWLTIGRCDGITPGIYYYDPVAHRLILVNSDSADSLLLLGGAAYAASGAASPDILITLTSRFQRLSWKYESMAYATTLKNVGVLYQTMYLVATAMHLNGCGIGNGNSRDIERILGIDPLRESPVGEFILNSSSLSPRTRLEPGRRQVNDYEWHVRSLQMVRDSSRSEEK